MSRKKRFIELSEGQKRLLEKGYKTGKSHLFRRKCQSMLLSNEGKTVTELSQIFEVSQISIYAWFNRWETDGIEGLKLKPGRGRPAKLRTDDQQQVKIVKILVENEPKNLNRVVGQVQSELGVSVSKKTLQRFLKNLNTSGSVFAGD
ncbi:MAG: helix-turn-helix domain-containing protein [Cyclobacteriaceae bacterium]